MKKRQVMSLVLAGIMAASLTACGGGTAANNKETKAEAGQTESGKTESSKTEASSKTEDRTGGKYGKGQCSHGFRRLSRCGDRRLWN